VWRVIWRNRAMRKLFLFALLSFCQLAIAAENDPPPQDVDLQEALRDDVGFRVARYLEE